MTIDPKNTDDQTDGNVDHLDFLPRCDVGHKDGARRNFATGGEYEPCEDPAVFTSHIHGHDGNDNATPMVHLWCPKHLSEYTVGFQEWIASVKPPEKPFCRRCKTIIRDLKDLIYDLKTLE